MGVPGLWDLLRPAAARTSLSALSREAFQTNHNGLRAFTVGIDASIWIFHAQVTHYGENPFLRTIFFKITALLQQPVLPVFVFDGPHKPNQKRNQNVAGQFGTADYKSKQFKALLDVCGLEWWNAPGEAEAELAVMNRQGKIDAVLSDDVDALLFGATCLLRNNSPTLSGAQASSTTNNSARGDMRNYEVYRSSAIKDLWTKKDGTNLVTEEDCRMAMVLIALLGGGDYVTEGLPSIGPTISFGLANAGLSDFLKKYNSDRQRFDSSLPSIHERIVEELKTNSSKQIGRRYPDRANKLSALSPEAVFPSFTLDAYLNPCTSPAHDPVQGWPGFGQGESSRTRGKARNAGRGDMEGLAIACEKYFEWGTKDIVVKKFAGESVGVFGAEIMNEARQTVRSGEKQDIPLIHQSVGTSKASSSTMITSFFSQSAPSSSPSVLKTTSSSQRQPSQSTNDDQIPDHVSKIHSIRVDPTNPEMNEYRISFKHENYVKRCHGVMQGTRSDPAYLSDNTRKNLSLREKSIEDDDLPMATQATGNGNLNRARDEIRVWMSEYLVREAWPDLIKFWEEEKAFKPKNKSPKKTKTLLKPPPKKGKGKAVDVNSINTSVFDAFYAGSIQRVNTQTLSRLQEAVEEEEEEPIEYLPPRPRSKSFTSPAPGRSPSLSNLPDQNQGKKSKSRPCPTSSLSSLLDTSSPSRGGSPTPTKSRSTKGRPRPKSKRTNSPKPSSPSSDNNEHLPRPTSPKRPSSPKKWPISKRVFSKSKSSPSALMSPAINKGAIHQPIDLCSSTDDETPKKVPVRSRRGSKNHQPLFDRHIDDTPILKPSHRRVKNVITSPLASPIPVLGSSSRANTISPPLMPGKDVEMAKASRASRASKSEPTGSAQPKSKSRSQSILDFPIISQSGSLNINSKQVEKSTKSKRTSLSPKKKKLHYVVVSETSDEEIIDCTRRK
ncbi:uncharacterized protein IL334_003937 [Kwoniella shivajii]|uniref:XPG-I domain-containing protein n=1 Tax=Kwoniella shivajii TaxID=564305 RepID=A0ABZ1D314_9TREE|nr:hypothetical protein IL334_003937 [Kwoniella shivajii]